jgi:hypothetical protein
MIEGDSEELLKYDALRSSGLAGWDSERVRAQFEGHAFGQKQTMYRLATESRSQSRRSRRARGVRCDSVDDARYDVNLKVAKVIGLSLVPSSVIFSAVCSSAKPLAEMFERVFSVCVECDAAQLKLGRGKAGIGVGAPACVGGPLRNGSRS